MDNLPTLITLLIALSVATERFVEIVKGFFWWLNQRKEDPRLEAKRKVALQALAVFGGVVITGLAWPVVREIVPVEPPPTGQTGAYSSLLQVPSLLTVLALGLLSSGGSGFWNTMLTYVTNLKELRRADLQAIQQEGAAARPLPQPSEGTLTP